MNRKIFCIIPVHNGLPHVIECIESIKKQRVDGHEVKIVIVDDGSTDSTAKVAQSKWSDIDVLYGDGNLWWTGAISMGTDYAIKNKADYVFWLNHDDRLSDQSLRKLIEAYEPNSIQCCGVVYGKDNPRVLAGLKLNFFRWYVKPILYDRSNLESQTSCHRISIDLNGAHGVLIPVGIFQSNCDLIRPRLFPHYCGDFDFYFQARRKGIRIYSVFGALSINNPSTSGLTEGKRIQRISQIPNYLLSRRSMGNLRDRPLMALLNFPPVLNLLWAGIFVLSSLYCCLFYFTRKNKVGL
ncbi:MAG: glycosyltransferase family 2 protein [Bdellovibrionales bacterium]|nr:glycosyltransferase family 2 protein [Bdellovibrionales bacterium]